MIAPPRGENLEALFASATSTVDPIGGLSDLIGVLLAARPPWHADALCQEHPEISYFPGQGDDVRPAKRICGDCLVRVECRAWALDQGSELDGIWAGLSKKQRSEMRRAVPVDQRVKKTPRPRTVNLPRGRREKLPTRLMERVSAFVAANPGEDHTAAAVDRAVGGSRTIGRALAALVDGGYVTLAAGGLDGRGRRSPRRRAYRHVRTFTVASEPAEAVSAA